MQGRALGCDAGQMQSGGLLTLQGSKQGRGATALGSHMALVRAAWPAWLVQGVGGCVSAMSGGGGWPSC